uniref:C2H2-type domain-containing protein n=1 Tax=Panagrolaimus sp. ES5 TaxID=591445 RepID=A0AC34FNN7_9BILA
MPKCKNCDETFRSKNLLRLHLLECIELSDDESDSSYESIERKQPRKVKKVEPLSQSSIQSNNVDIIAADADDNSKKEEAEAAENTFSSSINDKEEEAEAAENTFSSSINDVIDKKDIKRELRCQRCQKIMINEEHQLSHECEPKSAELIGSLEERKQALFKYYQEAFIKARNEVYDRVYPAFKYDAMVEVGISVSGLAELSRSKHANVSETKNIADVDFDRKHRMLMAEYEQKILETAKSIRCQNCNEPAKFYCCKDGSFCSVECQEANLHYIDCFKKLNDPYKDAEIPKIKRIPKLNFDV